MSQAQERPYEMGKVNRKAQRYLASLSSEEQKEIREKHIPKIQANPFRNGVPNKIRALQGSLAKEAGEYRLRVVVPSS